MSKQLIEEDPMKRKLHITTSSKILTAAILMSGFVALALHSALAAKTDASQANDEKVPEINLLTAMRDGLVAVQAEGRGDGRMTMSLTNRTRRRLRVVLPPGIIAQSATGQFGGMGGMGGGGMGGGGMGGGGMGGGGRGR